MGPAAASVDAKAPSMTDKTQSPDYQSMADAILKIARELCRQSQDSGNADHQKLAERLKRIAIEIRQGMTSGTPAV
jgi:hypothetical protein